ncbi:MAG: Gfo/Idh/MocA family oxidoreductase [Clostridia bacterium]|nr:Gfo/Idh/MocA family oxidoreductase [Clostridia bacterium]
MSNIVRIGIIGVGTMGHAHARHLYEKKTENAVLTALCDTDSARREELSSLFPNIPVFENDDAFFAAGLCDAVIIATPHYAHPVIGMKAFDQGLHVLTEKPMAVQLSAAKAFAEASQKSGRVFSTMFNQRTDPLFQKARELVKEGVIGAPKRFHWIITNWYRTQKYYDSGSWRATWCGEGGGVLMNQAPHNLDLWQWIFGMPKRIRAFCSEGKYHRIEVEDEALIYAEYENGATAVFQTMTGEYPGTNRLEITGDGGKIVLENGVLKLWRLQQSEREFCFEATESFSKIPMEYEEFTFPRARGAHGRIIQNFVDHILFNVPLLSHGEEAVNEVTLCNAAYLSSWKDCWVDLPMETDEFDAELNKRILNSQKRSAASSSETVEYQERWQVRW